MNLSYCYLKINHFKVAVLVYEVSMQAQNQGLHFKRALIDHPQISAILTTDEIDQIFDLEQSTGVCADMVDQVLVQIDLP